jgi:hypothetical protein
MREYKITCCSTRDFKVERIEDKPYSRLIYNNKGVFFVIDADKDLVMIDYAISIRGRIAQLNKYAKKKLILVSVITGVLEAEVHYTYRHYKCREKWYYIKGELKDYLDTCSQLYVRLEA